MLEVETVLIQWSGQQGERVEVAGQFSNWEPLTMSRSQADCWALRLKLKHGEYQIKFLVDGEWTLCDQLETVEDADGNINNLLVVEPITNVDDENDEVGMESLESVDKVTDHLTEITSVAEETVEVALKWTGRASLVTVSGDFSNWESLTMSQVENDLWRIVLKVSRGSHLLNFSVDGEKRVSDHMEKHLSADNEVFNILDVSADGLEVSQDDCQTEIIQCKAFNDGVIGHTEVSPDLEIKTELIHEIQSQDLLPAAIMNEKEFARADTDNIDDAEIGGNAGVCEKTVKWRGFARDVKIVGDFSNWTPISLSNIDSDQWSLTLKLPEGPHLMKFIVDKKFVLTEELEKVIGPDQELYNLVDVGVNDWSSHEIKYESDSEPTSMVVIESQESRDYTFKPFDDSFVETGHWVETGYNFATLPPEDLSIIYEEDPAGQSHVEGIETNDLVGKTDKETEDASDFDKASTELTNEKQMLSNDKLQVTATKKFSDDSLPLYCGSPDEDPDKDRTEVVDTCIRWIGFARHVQIIGDFSNWVPLILSNEKDDVWQLVLKLPLGSYLMKYIVDGRYVINEDMERRRGPDGEIYNLLEVTCPLEDQDTEILRTKSSPVESLAAESLQDSGYDQSFEETKQFSSSSSTNDDYDKESQILGSLTPEIDQNLVDGTDIPIIRTDSQQLSVFLGCKDQEPDIPSLAAAGNDEQLAGFVGLAEREQTTAIPIIRSEEDQLAVFNGSTGTQLLEEEITSLVRQITEDAALELGKESTTSQDGNTQVFTEETTNNKMEIADDDGNKRIANTGYMQKSDTDIEFIETNNEKCESLGRLEMEPSRKENMKEWFDDIEKEVEDGLENNPATPPAASKMKNIYGENDLSDHKEIPEENVFTEAEQDSLKQEVETPPEVIENKPSNEQGGVPICEEVETNTEKEILVSVLENEEGNEEKPTSDRKEKVIISAGDYSEVTTLAYDEKSNSSLRSDDSELEYFNLTQSKENPTDNFGSSPDKWTETPGTTGSFPEYKLIEKPPSNETFGKSENGQDNLAIEKEAQNNNNEREKLVENIESETAKSPLEKEEILNRAEEERTETGEEEDKIRDAEQKEEAFDNLEDTIDSAEKKEEIVDSAYIERTRTPPMEGDIIKSADIKRKEIPLEEDLGEIYQMKDKEEKESSEIEKTNTQEQKKEIIDANMERAGEEENINNYVEIDEKNMHEKKEEITESAQVERMENPSEKDIPEEISDAEIDKLKSSEQKDSRIEKVKTPTPAEKEKIIDHVDVDRAESPEKEEKTGRTKIPIETDQKEEIIDQIEIEIMKTPEQKEEIIERIETEIMMISEKEENIDSATIKVTVAAVDAEVVLVEERERENTLENREEVVESNETRTKVKSVREEEKEVTENSENTDDDNEKDIKYDLSNIEDMNVEDQAIIDDINIQNFIDKNKQMLNQSKIDEQNQVESADSDEESKEQALIDDMNIQNFIDKNNQLLAQSKCEEIPQRESNADKETNSGTVNDAFVNCDDETPKITNDKDEVVTSNTNTDIEENEVVKSAINAVEANVAKIEEALKVQEEAEEVDDGNSSGSETKSKPLMKSICNMCTLM